MTICKWPGSGLILNFFNVRLCFWLCFDLIRNILIDQERRTQQIRHLPLQRWWGTLNLFIIIDFFYFLLFFDLCAQGLWASDFYGLGQNLTGRFRVKSSFWTTLKNEIRCFIWRMWECWRSRQTCRPDYAMQQVRSLKLETQLKVLRLKTEVLCNYTQLKKVIDQTHLSESAIKGFS